MDIYQLLKQDHRKVEDLFNNVTMAKSSAKRKSLILKIKHELLIHAEAEDATFYEALKQHAETKSDIAHAEKEHNEIKILLHRLSKIDTEDAKWLKVFNDLKAAVLQHVAEEENKIFSKAQDILPHDYAVRLAIRMKEMKDQISQRKLAA